MNVHWYDGGLKPHRPAELDFSLNLPRRGLLFVGASGKIISDYVGGNPFKENGRTLEGGLLLPEDKFLDFEELTSRDLSDAIHQMKVCVYID